MIKFDLPTTPPEGEGILEEKIIKLLLYFSNVTEKLPFQGTKGDHMHKLLTSYGYGNENSTFAPILMAI